MPTYVATVNIPGYLPMDDDPPTFETPSEAWAWASSELWRYMEDSEVPEDGPEAEPFKRALQEIESYEGANKTGVVFSPRPDLYDSEHDLGLAWWVTEAVD